MGFRKKNENGLTLVELVVTLLISSILFLVLGAIVVAANEWWIKSRIQMQSLDEMRYANRRIGFLLRNAAYVTPTPHYTFEDNNSGTRLDFNDNTSSIRLQDNRLIHFTTGGTREVLLTDVVRAEMTVIAENFEYPHVHKLDARHRSCVCVTLVTEKDAPNGEIIRSSTTYIYKSRNSGL